MNVGCNSFNTNTNGDVLLLTLTNIKLDFESNVSI